MLTVGLSFLVLLSFISSLLFSTWLRKCKMNYFSIIFIFKQNLFQKYFLPFIQWLLSYVFSLWWISMFSLSASKMSMIINTEIVHRNFRHWVDRCALLKNCTYFLSWHLLHLLVWIILPFLQSVASQETECGWLTSVQGNWVMTAAAWAPRSRATKRQTHHPTETHSTLPALTWAPLPYDVSYTTERLSFVAKLRRRLVLLL